MALAALSFALSAQASQEAEELEAAFDAVLAAHVQDGWVDYAALKASPKALDTWLGQVAKVSQSELSEWSKNHQIAFYINAYNGHALRIVRDRYPIRGKNSEFPESSIQQIPDVWKLPIDIAGETLNLDKVEKEIVLGELGTYKAHFGFVCASVGCPALKNEAFHGGTLDRELNLAAQVFLRSPQGAQVDRKAKKLRVSQLFNWYAADFAHLRGTAATVQQVFAERAPIIEFVGSYLEKADRDWIRRGNYDLEYLPYDWTLNDISNR